MRLIDNYRASHFIKSGNFKKLHRLLLNGLNLNEEHQKLLSEKIKVEVKKLNQLFPGQYVDPLSEYKNKKTKLYSAVWYFFVFTDAKACSELIDDMVDRPNYVSLQLIQHVFTELQSRSHQIGITLFATHDSDRKAMRNAAQIVIKKEWLEKLEEFEMQAYASNSTSDHTLSSYAKSSRTAMIMNSKTSEEIIQDESFRTELARRYLFLLRHGAISELDKHILLINRYDLNFQIFLDIKELYPNWDLDLSNALIDMELQVIDEYSRMLNDIELFNMISDIKNKKYAADYIGDTYPFICELSKRIGKKYEQDIKFREGLPPSFTLRNAFETFLTSTDSPVQHLCERMLNDKEFISFFPQFPAIGAHIDQMAVSENHEEYIDGLLQKGLHYYSIAQVEIGDLFIDKFARKRTAILNQSIFDELLKAESEISIKALKRFLRDSAKANGQPRLLITADQTEILFKLALKNETAYGLLESFKKVDWLSLTLDQEAQLLFEATKNGNVSDRLIALQFKEPPFYN